MLKEIACRDMKVTIMKICPWDPTPN